MKVLIDVNVVLDVVLNRLPWAPDALRIWQAIHHGRIHGYLAATGVTNLFYIARRSRGAAAILDVRHCLSAFSVLTVDHAVLHAAAGLPGDFEDNVSIRCAVGGGIDFIITRDPRGYIHSPVTAVSPADFCTRYLASQP